MKKDENNKQEHAVDINVGGDVSGDIHLDRHDTHIDHSVSGVTAKGDAVIATGGAKVTLIKVIPSWVWMVLFLTILASAIGFWGSRYITKKKLEARITFQPDELGILIANLKPLTQTQEETQEAKRFLADVQSELVKLIEKTGERDIVVRPVAPAIVPYFENAQDVEAFAEKYGAKLVIWGNIDMEGGKGQIRPRVQSVKYEPERHELWRVSGESEVVELESSLKSFLAGDMQRLLFFILGYMYYMQPEKPKDLETRVIHYFQNALGFENPLNNAYVHFYLGNVYYFMQKPELAGEEYKKLLADDGETMQNGLYNFGLTMELFNNLGLLALRDSQDEEALQYFQTADEYGQCSQESPTLQEEALSPGCVSLLYNLASVFLEQGDYATAIEYGEKAINLFEQFQEDFPKSFLVQILNDTALSYIRLAQAERNPIHLEKAQAHLEQVTKKMIEQNVSHLSQFEMNAANGALYRNWGRVYLGLENWERALESLEQSKTFEPDNPKVSLLLAQLYNERCQQGDGEHYLKEVQRYLEKMRSVGQLPEALKQWKLLEQHKRCVR